MHNWFLRSLLLSAAVMAGCHGGSNVVPSGGGEQSVGQAVPSGVPMGTAAIPKSYQCFPSSLPGADTANAVTRNPAIAYADLCSVGAAREKANLQAMAISLAYKTGGSYQSYCTGTPISYDPNTGIGFIVTAAHCVVGGRKLANTELLPKNITTFVAAGGEDMAEVYQGTPSTGVSAGELTGAINAVYVPSRYCAVPAIRNDTCTDLSKQNGDVAVLKIVTSNGAVLHVMPKVRLAPRALTIPTGSDIMALGYGTNTSKAPASNVLYYIDYQYFAKNNYKGESAQAAIMNGYHPNANYYSIICQGDSGGPDYYWDGTYWNLVGAHSYGPNPCGTWGAGYGNHEDISADTRLFTAWVGKILTMDAAPTGCKKIGPAYTCAGR
jgi:hypothetical protein